MLGEKTHKVQSLKQFFIEFRPWFFNSVRWSRYSSIEKERNGFDSIVILKIDFAKALPWEIINSRCVSIWRYYKNIFSDQKLRMILLFIIVTVKISILWFVSCLIFTNQSLYYIIEIENNRLVLFCNKFYLFLSLLNLFLQSLYLWLLFLNNVSVESNTHAFGTMFDLNISTTQLL
jgi:hypothetical protein